MRLEETGWAKLNLALHVRRRRADGYHDLETIFAFTELGDTLAAEPADGLTLDVVGPFGGAIPPGGDNLVRRAALALDRAAGEQGRGAALSLSKNLPVAAGLGGGSADAAAALRLLNRLWNLGFSTRQLAAVGAGLGADIAACVHSLTMRGEGRGDVLAPIDDTGLAGTPVLLVNPRVAVPTPAVFARWDGIDRGPLGVGDPVAAAAAGRNDLQPAALLLAPVIATVLDALASCRGAQFVRMSGSGATCFALFSSEHGCREAAATLQSDHDDWWIAPTRLRI